MEKVNYYELIGTYKIDRPGKAYYYDVVRCTRLADDPILEAYIYTYDCGHKMYSWAEPERETNVEQFVELLKDFSARDIADYEKECTILDNADYDAI